MSIKSFLKLVEIQTKVASVFPFAAGTLFAVVYYRQFDLFNFLLMFAALLAIDMFTTTLNNYMDFKLAEKRHGYGYEVHNAIVSYKIPESRVLMILAFLFVFATGFGMVLVWRTGLLVLVLGAISFAAGILYSSGPVPLSRTPLGELVSGGFMGILIPFLAVIIHVDSGWIFNASVDSMDLLIQIKWKDLLFIFLATMPFFGGIANIMLANNICDQEDDRENRRYTLPLYIETKLSLLLYVFFYALGYVAVAALICFRVFPWWYSAFFLTLIPLVQNIRAFFQKQIKAETFVLSVKNFVLQSSAFCLLLGINALKYFH